MPTNTGQQMDNLLVEDAFFQGDCLLDDAFFSAVLMPPSGLLAALRAVPNNDVGSSYGTVGSVAYDATGTQPDYPCDPATIINPSWNNCKILFNNGEFRIESQTFRSSMIRENACRSDKFYDNFFVPTDSPGIPGAWTQGFGELDIRALFLSAVMRQMADMSARSALWMQEKIWNGDPANNTANGGYKEFYGIENLNVNTWGTDATLPITSQSATQADCDVMDNTTIDFASAKVGGGVASLFGTLQNLERTIYEKARMSQMLPVDWVFVMTPNMWYEMVKIWPCEMASDGCTIGVVNANDGGSGMFNMAERERLLNTNTIRLNGRNYSVILDTGITETADTPTVGDFTSDIHFIPLTVRGIPATFIEYKDFSRYNERFVPLPEDPERGWSDGGKFYHYMKFLEGCFSVVSSFENRLIFRAPNLAGRVTNVVVCPTSPIPDPTVAYTASV